MHHPTFTCGHEDTSFVWRYARRTESTHKEYSLHTSSTIRYVHQKGTISTNSQYGVVACVQKCKCVQIRDNVLFWWRQTGISSVCFGADSEQTMSAHKRVAFNLKRILIRLRWIWANDCYTIWSTKYTLRTARTSTRASLFAVMEFYYLVLLLLRGKPGAHSAIFASISNGFRVYDQLGLHWGKASGFLQAQKYTHTHIDRK